MRKALLFTILLSLNADLAFAQTEAQKRKAHLPYIRTATDCIANGILENEISSSHAARGNWYDAIGLVKTCNPAIHQMIVQHDIIYGGGGSDFFKGPYLADLPRALSTRIKPELDRRTAAAEERQRNEQEANARRQQAQQDQRSARDTLMRDALNDHKKCVDDAIASILPLSSENAESVTIAVMSLCSSHESKLSKLASALFSVTQEAAESHISKIIATRRNDVTKEIVVIRAAAEAMRRNARQGTNPAVPASPNQERSF